MSVTRPITATEKCAYCGRRRLRKNIELHSGVEEWHCSDIDDCEKSIAKAKP